MQQTADFGHLYSECFLRTFCVCTCDIAMQGIMEIPKISKQNSRPSPYPYGQALVFFCAFRIGDCTYHCSKLVAWSLSCDFRVVHWSSLIFPCHCRLIIVQLNIVFVDAYIFLFAETLYIWVIFYIF